jgi:hypothetical protein
VEVWLVQRLGDHHQDHQDSLEEFGVRDFIVTLIRSVCSSFSDFMLCDRF